MKIYNFSRYSFLNEAELITEDGEFQQFQFGIEPMGTSGGGGNFAFAQDPSSSYYNYQDSPYTDFYARQSGLVSNLDRIMKQNRGKDGMIYKNPNPFLEDINDYKNIKILRMFENNNLKLDIFLSYEFNKGEFFGVIKNFNAASKPKFESEIFYNPEYQYRFDTEYKLRLSNYFFKKLEKWFIPEKGFYKNLKDNNPIKSKMGKLHEVKSNKVVEVLGYNTLTNDERYIILKYKGETYHVESNDYFYFKWRFEKINEKLV